MSNTRYNPSQVESKWYDHWLKHQYFRSTPDEREAYTIVMPPPNVTGRLHMGHMLNITVQDILIRRARLQGKNACYVPGTDHASIATEAKVVNKLRAQGIKKSDLSREDFLKHAWEWKEEYGGIILSQLHRLGASADWDRTRFTMEPKLTTAVFKVFVDLHRKGLIYRGLRMTNWDPAAQTALSNEEVIYSDENSALYHLQYPIEGEEGKFVTIATVRPETILGDTAIAVHPNDDRYTDLVGKTVLVPLINRSIPIIADTYVEREFGTGALKITPAHDQNDYEIGQRHNLPSIDVLNPDGTMSETAQMYIGMDRMDARKAIVKELKAQGFLVDTENYRNKVGRSERTGAVIEPRLTEQWFLNMKGFAAQALHAVGSGQVTFYPESMWNMYLSWLHEDNVRDWCISRQLWWGQRIPAWYYGEGNAHTFVAETAEEALAQAKAKLNNPDLTIEDLRQDEDVLDTWFSSWLWPISVFDGFEHQEELEYYYPTQVLVTGWDIMFFWVARMIMSGYEWSGELMGLDHVMKNGRHPFDVVYFTGMVRDNKRRKMSKSLGNSPDAIALLDTYGADGVRFGMLSSAAAGNDIIFDAPFDQKTNEVMNESNLCKQGRNFCNKLWNACQLIKGITVVDQVDEERTMMNALAVEWFQHLLQQNIEKVEAQYDQYRLSEAIMGLYNFIWGDFCSWYLEIIKSSDKTLDRATYTQTIQFFEQLMTLLHPFMPFVTEEIWHELKDRAEGEDCVISSYPTAQVYDETLLKQFESIKTLVGKVRDMRNKNGLSQSQPLPLFAEKGSGTEALFNRKGLPQIVIQMASLESFEQTATEPDSSVSILSGTEKYYLVFEQEINVEEERKRIMEELDYQKGFMGSVEKKLSNERFVQNAPPAVVDKERKKLSDSQDRIKILEESLARLERMN